MDSSAWICRIQAMATSMSRLLKPSTCGAEMLCLHQDGLESRRPGNKDNLDGYRSLPANPVQDGAGNSRKKFLGSYITGKTIGSSLGCSGLKGPNTVDRDGVTPSKTRVSAAPLHPGATQFSEIVEGVFIG